MPTHTPNGTNFIPLQTTQPPHTPPLRRFSPERWLLLGRSTAWLRAASQWMHQQEAYPGVLGWRVRRGLLQATTPEDFPATLGQALAGQPAAVFVLAERAAFRAPQAGVDALIARSWPADAPLRQDDAQVYVGYVDDDFDNLQDRLSHPDSEATEHWLLSGRSQWPQIGLQQAAPAFEAEALQAFQHWADAYLRRHDPHDLDAIYGSVSTYAARMATDWKDDELAEQPTAGGPSTTVEPVDGRPAVRLRGRLAAMRGAAQGLAAAAAGVSRARDTDIKGHFDGYAGSPDIASAEAIDRFHLTAPGRIAPGRNAEALTVELELASARWQDHCHLVLEIHTDSLPMQLLHWSLSDTRTEGRQTGTFKLSRKVDCTEQQRLAMMMGVELWLAPASSTQLAPASAPAITEAGRARASVFVVAAAVSGMSNLLKLLDVILIKPSMPGGFAGASAMSAARPDLTETPVFILDWTQDDSAWRMQGWRGGPVTLERIAGPDDEPSSVVWGAADRDAEHYPLSRDGDRFLIDIPVPKAMRRAEGIAKVKADAERVTALLPIVH